MSAIRVRLLLAVMLFLGVVLVCVRLFQSEPEQDHNPLTCPTCGKMLQEKNAPCLYCEAKKTREKLESSARGGTAKPAPSNEKRSKAIVAGVAVMVLLGVVFWPQIRRAIRSRQKEPEVEYRLFKCPRCGRKLRYRASMIGTQGMCPTCKDIFTFPVGDEDTGDDF